MPSNSLSRKEVETLVDANAAALALPLTEALRPGVVENMSRICTLAQSVMEFPLPAETEPAPVFIHAPG